MCTWIKCASYCIRIAWNILQISIRCLILSLHGKYMGKKWKQWQILFSWAPKTLGGVTEATKLKDTCSFKKSNDKTRQHTKKQRHHFADKGLNNQNYGFSSSHVWMWELDHKEGGAPKNWCFRTVVPEKDLRVPWTAKGSNQSMPKKSTLNTHCKYRCWSWSSNPLATWCEEPTQWKRRWCWESLSAEGEGGDRGWDG